MSYELIALCNGHGLNTGGKRTPIFTDGTKSPYTGESFMHEWEFNRRTVQLLKGELERCGFRTIEVSPSEANTDLMERCRIANQAGADFYVSVHANAMTGVWNTLYKGIETLTWGSGESLRIGQILQKSLVAATGAQDRGMQDGKWLAVVKYTSMPAALVECGFMDYLPEAKKLLSEDYRRLCAVAIAKGICEGFGRAYVPASVPAPVPAPSVVSPFGRAIKSNYKGTDAAVVKLAKGTFRGEVVHLDNAKVSELVRDRKADFGINFTYFITETGELIGDVECHDETLYSAYGKMLKWFEFAVVDGKPAIGQLNIQDKQDFLVQGSPPLVEQGAICYNRYLTEMEVPADIAYSRAQRTAVGIDKDGNLIISVSDGREGGPSRSPGFSLGELSEFMLSQGAVDALNGDGGSSSVLADPTGSLMQNSGKKEAAVNHAILFYLVKPYRMQADDANKVIALLKAAYGIAPNPEVGRLGDELRKASNQAPENTPADPSFNLMAKVDVDKLIGILRSIYAVVPSTEVGRLADELRKASGQATEN